jgi:ADP-ribosyl-[dinitrogen reductase] hydrolase
MSNSMTQTKARTSITHPLIINTIPVSNGELGLTFCPGKKQPNAMTGSWDRDIDLDIESVKRWGATAVISLLEDFEYYELAVRNLPSVYEDNFRWLNLPIPDKCAPEEAWLADWLDLRNELKTLLINNGKILIHCKGGFGRTGTVAALILMDHGYTAIDAITACRQAREFAVETEAQEKFVMAYERLKLS